MSNSPKTVWAVGCARGGRVQVVVWQPGFSLVKCLETERGLVGRLRKAQQPDAVITHWSLGIEYDWGGNRAWERLSGRLVGAHSAHLDPLSAGVTRRAKE
jgi:hypothetical protein